MEIVISHYPAFVAAGVYGAFILLLALLPKGREPTHPNRGPEVNAIRDNEIDSELRLLADSLGPMEGKDAFGYFKEKLFRAIDYAIRRHDWYEDQRSKVFQQTITICFAILTISLTVTGLVFKEPDPPRGLFWSLFTFILIALTSVVHATLIYNKELNRSRPYRLISDIRFWFFTYNLPDAAAGADKQTVEIERAKHVASERRRFFSRVIDNATIDASIREDLEQLFILQILQRSKMESLQLLQWLLTYLATFTALVAFLTFILLAVSRL